MCFFKERKQTKPIANKQLASEPQTTLYTNIALPNWKNHPPPQKKKKSTIWVFLGCSATPPPPYLAGYNSPVT